MSVEAPLDNEDLRRAFALSLQRRRTVEAAFANGALAEGSLVPEPLLPGESQQDHNATLAIFELGGSGHAFGSGIRHLRLIYPNSGIDGKVAFSLSRLWRKSLGIDIVPTGLSSDRYQRAIHQGKFDLALVRWQAESADPSNFLQDQLYSHGPDDFSGWSNNYYDHLIRASLTQGIDSTTRRQDLLGAEAIAARQAPWIPLDVPLQAALIRPQTRDVALSPEGIIGLG